MKITIKNSRPECIEKVQGDIFVEWHCYKKRMPDTDIEEAEALFYRKHFAAYIERHNSMCDRYRHKNRKITADDYRTAKRTQPEETEYCLIGKDAADTDTRLFTKAVSEYLDLRKVAYPGVKMLDFVVFSDDNGLYVRERHVWIAHDEYGDEIVSQRKALEEMEVQPLFSDRPDGWNNNAKMRYTNECKIVLTESCRRNGINID